MKNFCIALCIATFSVLAHAEIHGKLTPKQAAARTKTAHSEADYRELATFYQRQARAFSSAARQQHEAYDYALHHWSGKSYPQPADRARTLSEYYQERSRQSTQLATTYADKAEAFATKTAGTVTTSVSHSAK